MINSINYDILNDMRKYKNNFNEIIAKQVIDNVEKQISVMGR